MFRHVVLLTLNAETTAAELDALVDGLHGLPAEIPELKRYEVGVDAGVSEGNATLAVVADCDDQAGWEAYRDHPAHQKLIAELLRPHLVSRTAVQHQL